MEEKIYSLIRERGPWFLKENIFSQLIFNILSKYLRIDELKKIDNFLLIVTPEGRFDAERFR